MNKKRIGSLLSLIYLCMNQICSQTMILPMDIPPYLSGNFGELRGNHFHSGIDFKTQGAIGFPVKAVKSGYISRIFISPTGFGRALYINHPDGTMTVYGHLDHFSEPIESLARDSQYVKESFAINLDLQPTRIRVKQGEIIAYSGNAGSSGGPHLHFEIRNAAGDVIMDPLPYYKKEIKDTRPPEIRSLMFFPQPGKGMVNDKLSDQSITVAKSKSGKQTLSKPVTAWGDLGIGIKAYDRMTGVENIYGTKEIILKVEGKIVFHSKLDKFSFAESRYVNSFISWDDWTNNNSFHMKSFVEPGNKLGIYLNSEDGVITIDEEKDYQMEYTLSDAYGNKTIFPFTITGKKQKIPLYKPGGILFAYNKDNHFSANGIDLSIPKGNLYTDFYFRSTVVKDYSPFAPLYQLKENVPLHTPCPLILDITNDTYTDKTKYGAVAVKKGRESWMGGTYKNGEINFTIREIGNYTIRIDTVAPVITPVSQGNWGVADKISFLIRDNLSGIASWRGTLNGKFALFEYDAKKSALFCVFDPSRMKKGTQQLSLTVTDGCGNSTNYKSPVAF